MIYLRNTTDSQDIYIARQSFQKDETREIDLSVYPQRSEVEEMISTATSEFITSGEVETMLDGYATEQWVSEQGYLSEGALSAYSTTEETQQMIDDAVSGIDLSNYYTSAETNEAIASAITANKEVFWAVYGQTSWSDIIAAVNTPKTVLCDYNSKIYRLTSYGYSCVFLSFQNPSTLYYIINAGGQWTNGYTNVSNGGLFASVDYVSSAKTIYFYDKTNTQVGSVDTTDFVKDGMVDNVYISGDTLYVVFNTDAGKETIELNIGDIFDASNYYTKTEVDGLFDSETARTESTYVKDDALSAYSTTQETQQMIDNAISGIDLSNYYTSAETESAITSKGYVTSGDVETQITSKGYITTADTQDFVTSGDVETQITDKGYVTSGDVETQITSKGYITTADTQDFVTSGDVETQITSKEYVTSGTVQTQIDNAVSGKQDTLVSGTNIKTINNESLLGSGNINIQGGGGANIIELTKAEYEALTAYTEDAMYVITDADSVDLNNFAVASAVTSAITDITTELANKATKASVSANTGRLFPRWNSEGIITGTTGNTVYERNININGSNNSIMRPTNSDISAIYAPRSAGVKGQPLLSNGSGEPQWATYKFAFLSQSEYDAITTKDASTIYFITSDV